MNSNALKAQLVLKGLRVPAFLDRLKQEGCEMSKNAFYRKLNGKSEFDRKEIIAIVSALELSSNELMEIFFKQKVS